MCHMTVSPLALGSYPTICENVARAAALCDLDVLFLLFSCFCLFAFVVCFVFLVFLLGLHTGLRTGPLPVPFRLAPCDLGDPGWESLVSAWCFCCLHSPSGWPGDFDVLPFASAAIPCLPYHVEMIQCYHLLQELAHELAPVTPRFGFVFFCCCVSVLCWVFVLCFWFLPSFCFLVVTS